MKEYSTMQRQQLLDFLKSHRDKQFSVDEIAQALGENTVISVSSVYRNINKMLAEGDIVRHSLDGSRKFVYQYVGDGACQGHLHMKCGDCGRLIHADSRLSEEILCAAASASNFKIDKKKTVLYGLCEDCDN